METANFNNLRVEIHGHKGADLNRPLDVTGFVSALEWSDSVRPPWNTCMVTLQCSLDDLQWLLPGSEAFDNHGDDIAAQESERYKSGVAAGAAHSEMARSGTTSSSPEVVDAKSVGGLPHSRRFRPGAWIVIRLHDVNATLDAPAVSFCYIDSVTIGLGQVTGINKSVTGVLPVVIKGISWFQAVAQSNIRIAATPETEANGSIFTLTSWSDELQTILQDAANPSLGQALQNIWQKLGALLPPDTLLSKAVGEAGFWQQTPVVYDDATAGRMARDRVGAMHQVFGAYLTNTPAFLPQSPVWAWLNNTFVPDDNIVEFFPSLEWPLTESPPEGDYPTTAGGERTSGSVYAPSGTVNATQLGQVLGGAQPVLVYRFKPFQLYPIDSRHTAKARGFVGGDMQPALQKPISEKIKVFQKPVYPIPKNAVSAQRYTFQSSDILTMSSVAVSENERVNLVYARNFLTGDAGIRMYNQGGNAVLAEPDEFRRYGLHAAEPVWPYVLTGNPIAGEGIAATPKPPAKETAAATAAVKEAAAAVEKAATVVNTLKAVLDTQKAAYDKAKAAHALAQKALVESTLGPLALPLVYAEHVAAEAAKAAKVLYDSAVGSVKAAETHLNNMQTALDKAKTAASSAKATATSAQQQNINDQLSALNEKLWTILGEGEKFVNLTMDVRCRPRVKAGMWGRFRLEDRNFMAVRNIGAYEYLTAYIEGVTHKMSRGAAGAWSTGTHLRLVRGLFSHRRDHFVCPVRACSVTKNQLNYGQAGSIGPEQLTEHFHSGGLGIPMSAAGADGKPLKGQAVGSPDGAYTTPAVRTALLALCQSAEKIFAVNQFKVVSGYRSPSSNVKAGGAPNSYHMRGMAIDMQPKGISPSALRDTIEKLITDKVIPQGGVIIYSTFVHYDQRGTKYRADKRTAGAADE